MESIGLSIAESTTLVVGLLAAAVTDLRTHRIPNILSLAVLVTGLAWHCVSASWAGFAAGLGGTVAGLVCFLPFYVRRAMGAGDVKWMASIGSFLGFKSAVLAAAFAMIAGGLVALAYLGWRALRGAAGAVRAGDVALAPTAAIVQATGARRERLPFAVPIAVGTLAVLLVGHYAGVRAIGFWGGP